MNSRSVLRSVSLVLTAVAMAAVPGCSGDLSGRSTAIAFWGGLGLLAIAILVAFAVSIARNVKRNTIRLDEMERRLQSLEQQKTVTKQP